MRLAVDGEWYDLSKWASFHPGGTAIMQHYDNMDATDAFYSLHSKEAAARLKKMAPVEDKTAPPAGDAVDKEFRAFRAKLEADGWFDRSFVREMGLLIPVLSMFVGGLMLAHTRPLLAVFFLGVAMQQAGWSGHDYTHARSSVYCDTLLPFVSGWINGFDRWWWSNKHNTHHVLTNHIGLDPDIDNRPFLFLWAPKKAADHIWRHYQHVYFLALYSFLYVSWRIQSMQYAIAEKRYKDIALKLVPSYLILAWLPLAVSVGAVLFGGFLVAIVVTLSHESEEMTTGRIPSYVKMQFLGTRDIVCPDYVTEYLGGGMQYQLIHHLFPTMPRYHYPAMVPMVKEFARANNLPYKSSSLGEMWSLHMKTLKRNALQPAV